MNEPTLAERVLVALFRRGQRNESIDIFGLGQDCEASLFAVLKTLDVLDRRGLADAGRRRLTLAGLAVAAAAHKQRRSRAEGARRAARSFVRPRHAA
jgi:hypothetical protein